MRYNEQAVQPSKEKEPKEEPRTLAGDKDYDYGELVGGKKLPLTGSNPWS